MSTSNRFKDLAVNDDEAEKAPKANQAAQNKKKKEKKKDKRRRLREEKAAFLMAGGNMAGRIGHLTTSEEATLAQFRSSFPKYTDRDLLRYLRARNFNLAQATAMLTATEAWRADFKPETITLEDIRVIYDQNISYQHGVDKMGRPLIWRIMCNNDKRWSHAAVLHTIYNVEQCISEMPEHTEQMCVIFDLTGYGRANSDLGYIKTLVDILQNHYPERLGFCLLVNAPMLLSVVWKIVKPWLAPSTIEKVVFIGGDYRSKIKAYVESRYLPKNLGGTSTFDAREWITQRLGPAGSTSADAVGQGRFADKIAVANVDLDQHIDAGDAVVAAGGGEFEGESSSEGD